MLVTKAIDEIQNKINDRDKVGLDDTEILSYLNEAIQFISSYLIGANSPFIIKEILIEDIEYVLPANYVRCVGTYPAKITGNKLELFDDPPMKFRYYESYKNVTKDDSLPFNHEALEQVAIKLACIYANAQEQLDVSQDKTLFDEMTSAIANAIGAAK